MTTEAQEVTTARIVAKAAEATAKTVADAATAAAMLLAKEHTAASTEIALIKNDLLNIKNQQTNFEGEVNKKLDGLSPKFDKIFGKLEEISLGRPTWAVTALLVFLFGLCSSLIVYIVTI